MRNFTTDASGYLFFAQIAKIATSKSCACRWLVDQSANTGARQYTMQSAAPRLDHDTPDAQAYGLSIVEHALLIDISSARHLLSQTLRS